MDKIEIISKEKTYKVDLWKILKSSRIVRIWANEGQLTKEERKIILTDFSEDTVVTLLKFFDSDTLPYKISKNVADELLQIADYLRIDYLIRCLNWKGQACVKVELSNYATEEEIHSLNEDISVLNLRPIKEMIRKYKIEVKEDYKVEALDMGENASVYFWKGDLISGGDFSTPSEFVNLIGNYYPFDFWDTLRNEMNIKPYIVEINDSLEKVSSEVYYSQFQILHRKVGIYFKDMRENRLRKPFKNDFLSVLSAKSYLLGVSIHEDFLDWYDYTDNTGVDTIKEHEIEMDYIIYAELL